MSRGPGRIQRAIEATFRGNPSATYAVDELAVLAYPGLNQVEKKHRVSVLRAADAAAKECGWWANRAEAPGHPVIYGNPVDLRSYATWTLRLQYPGNFTAERIVSVLEDPADTYRRLSWVQPGGFWWRHVEINKARAAGDHARADEMISDLNLSIAAEKVRALGR